MEELNMDFEYNFADKPFIQDFKEKLDNFISKCEHNWVHTYLCKTSLSWCTAERLRPDGVYQQVCSINVDTSGQFLVLELYSDVDQIDGAVFGCKFSYATDDLSEAMKVLTERLKLYQKETKKYYEELK